ncbi:MAG: cysteine hydrolase [Treponema sp.]|jgi:nicotinamidase-related amidase|nr:cysteine hydrolase [Treponema sp.]
MQTALLVIDLQNDFVGPGFTDAESAEKIKKRLVPGINTATSLFRTAGNPVIFVKMIYKKDKSNWTLRMKDLDWPYCIEDTPGSGFFEGLQTEKTDIIVTKDRYSAFYTTDLDHFLRKNSINTLVITGMNTHACVRSTVMDAFERDYRVFIPGELVDSYNPVLHTQSLAYLENRLAALISFEELRTRIATNDFTFQFT